MINQNLGKNFGYVRRHNKALLKQLLRNYDKRGGIYENFGQATLRTMNETIDKYLGNILSYQDAYKLHSENQRLINYINDDLFKPYNHKNVVPWIEYLRENKLYDYGRSFWNHYRY